MIISHEYKFIFIKTRKTAGSTFEALMYPHLNKETDICTGSPRDGTPSLNSPTTNGHATYAEAVKYAGDVDLGEYQTFTIERNPWDKMVSAYWWHYHTKSEWKEWVEDFDAYMFCPYVPKDFYKYHLDPNDWTSIVNVVYDYDDLAGMYEDMDTFFGIKIPESDWRGTKLKSGIRKSGHYSELHNDYTRECVEKMFAEEIEMMGYTYEQRSS